MMVQNTQNTHYLGFQVRNSNHPHPTNLTRQCYLGMGAGIQNKSDSWKHVSKPVHVPMYFKHHLQNQTLPIVERAYSLVAEDKIFRVALEKSKKINNKQL